MILVTRSGELNVAHIEGETQSENDYIDAHMAPDLVVVDSGRIIIRDGVDEFIAEARRHGFSVQQDGP